MEIVSREKKENGIRGGAWAPDGGWASGTKEDEGGGKSIFTVLVFNYLFASVILKIVLCTEALLDPDNIWKPQKYQWK